MTLAVRQTLNSPVEVPHKHILEASDRIRSTPDVFKTLNDYPNDPEGILDGLVLSRAGFEAQDPWRLCICDDCIKHLRRARMPPAALANGFWTGDLPTRFSDVTWVERIAASAVRVKGHVVALESRNVQNVPGSAQRSIRGTSVFYSSNSCSVATELPLAESGLLDMITVILTGSRVPTEEQLRRLLGARKQVIADLISYMQDEENELVLGFPLSRGMEVNEASLDTFDDDGSVPPTLLRSILKCTDDTTNEPPSTYTNDRREDEIVVDDEPEDVNSRGEAYIIDSYSVMDSGENAATSQHCRPEVLDRISDGLDNSVMTMASNALWKGLPVPGGKCFQDIVLNKRLLTILFTSV